MPNTLSNQQLVTPEGEHVIRVISDYARRWSLLQAYNERSRAENVNKQQGMRALDLNDVLAAVDALKRELMIRLVEHFILLGKGEDLGGQA